MTALTSFLRGGVLALGLTCGLSGTQASADTLFCPQTETRVAVLGDSLADGVWGAMFRGWLGCDTLDLYRVTEVGDGLAKSDPSAWSGRLTGGIGGAARTDLVVIQVGANDIRAIRTDGGRAVFDTPDWDTLYSDRARALLTAARGISDNVIWLGLPIVGDDKLEGPYSRVSALQAAVVQERAASDKQTLFVDMHEETQFGTGGYVQSVTLGDTLTQLRASDRIHFSERGYDMVVDVFSQEMEQRLKTGDLETNLNELILQ
ncbi:GDSL-type esterase/lipase family protein [Pseudooceanicola nanhaiensis]|uniref:DUF459 domain-containing protein n=1 Tax=Pseudooceanicola nanhaiensis TaxID=375761 RepID=UPI001CD3CBBB|nr:GDSL-type esterase/lipase family protein [Pseudooceanicola nanhaiensis]MCA0921173.1 GDSL-type esterase/lipase family protein [Pseudooceanicola nanhaiensis]